MNEHYYTASPSAAHDERAHPVEALGLALTFTTDRGVFSKGGLDEGSALLLAALPPLAGRVLDLGCGWGALGVTLAKKYPAATFVLSDVNARAVELARRNAAANGAANVEVVLSDGLNEVPGAFDAVVTNPPIRAGKALIYGMIKDAHARLSDGGALYAVIRKQQGAPSMLKYLQELSGDAEVTARSKGYWIIRCGKG